MYQKSCTDPAKRILTMLQDLRPGVSASATSPNRGTNSNPPPARREANEAKFSGCNLTKLGLAFAGSGAHVRTCPTRPFMRNPELKPYGSYGCDSRESPTLAPKRRSRFGRWVRSRRVKQLNLRSIYKLFRMTCHRLASSGHERIKYGANSSFRKPSSPFVSNIPTFT